MRSALQSTARRGSIALALGAAGWLAEPLHAQAPNERMAHHGAILVQAVDTSINPIRAEIVLPRFGFTVRLSEDGVILLMNIPDGTYLVQARLLGYRSEWRVVRIDSDTARIDFVLPPADPSRVGYALAESRLRDFLRQSRLVRQAAFITRAEIERRRPKNLAALLGRAREITIERSGPGLTVARSRRVQLPQCSAGMLMFVDGMQPMPPALADGAREAEAERRRLSGIERAMSIGSSRRNTARRPATSPQEVAGFESGVSSDHPRRQARLVSPLDWVPVDLVAGVEIYPTYDDVPSEFRVPGAECGAVLLWTTGR